MTARFILFFQVGGRRSTSSGGEAARLGLSRLYGQGFEGREGGATTTKRKIEEEE